MRIVASFLVLSLASCVNAITGYDCSDASHLRLSAFDGTEPQNCAKLKATSFAKKNSSLVIINKNLYKKTKVIQCKITLTRTIQVRCSWMLDGQYVYFVYMVKCKFHEFLSLSVELQCWNLFAQNCGMHSHSSVAKFTHLDETMDLSKSACEDFDKRGINLDIEHH